MESAINTWTTPDCTLDRCAMTEIPLMGAVAAGEPYHAFPLQESLSVPTALWGGRPVFALRVRGSSMIDEGIRNGDYIIVEPRPTAENGQTVVAEIDGAVTVKKYHRDADGSLRLMPANPELLPLVIRGEDVRIIGVVVGVLRKYGFGAPQPARARPTPCRPPVRRSVDDASIDIEVNAIDAQLARWNTAMVHAQRDRRLRQHVAAMSELGRDLQALRDWCARARRPGLRRALIEQANAVIRRMQRFATVTPVQLPDLVLH